ncbi:class II fumarate hydratase [Nonomuraea sp. NPDC005650]|uniref:class II fumarate hydratase n=1 Tax=Nonomuraea sp. NPDC005650 TaxID=3157045 RepID=UPI0033B8BDD0
MSAPRVRDVPIGLRATGTRTESDSLGEVEVPAGHYWGAQTQRSLIHFSIGDDRMPKAVYRAYGYIKKAAAIVNARAGRLPRWQADLISRVADEVISGELDGEFPLYVWQTGSGTQSNMNVNEVISNRAIQLVGGRLGSKDPVHPNDHVNMGQSSNDTFITAMHIAAAEAVDDHVLPAATRLRETAEAKSRRWEHEVKIGRTHLEDATPLTVGQEWSGYVAQLGDAIDHLERTRIGLYRLAIGGTAVGTGLNAPPGFGEEVAEQIAGLTGRPFVSAPSKFAAQASCDDLVRASAALRTLAVPLFKFANDLRWLGSGPRTGLHELILPANEPGSSIMPGKVNPTQAEAMLMVAIQVAGNDIAVSMAGAEGNFELNAFRPVIIKNVLHSARILADMMDHFRTYLVEGAKLNTERLRHYVDHSIMMVTALSPVVGYDQAARIAHHALDNDLPLRDAALQCGIAADLYDRIVRPESLTKPGVPSPDGGGRR